MHLYVEKTWGNLVFSLGPFVLQVRVTVFVCVCV